MEVTYKINSEEEACRIADIKIQLPQDPQIEIPDIQNHTFSLSEFNFCVAKIIGVKNLPQNMNYLNKLLRLDGFSSDSIEYQDQFIDKFSQIFHSFLNSAILIPINSIEAEENVIENDKDYFLPDICTIHDTPNLLCNSIDSLSKIWTITTFKPTLLNDNLINDVIMNFNKVSKTNMSFQSIPDCTETPIYIPITEEFSHSFLLSIIESLINLSNYMSSLVMSHLNRDFFEVICWHLQNSENDLQYSILKLLEIVTKCEDSIEFHAELPQILIPCLIDKMSEFLHEASSSILNLIKNYGHQALFIALDRDILSALPMIQNSVDLSIVDPSLGIFNSVLECLSGNIPNEYQTLFENKKQEIIDSFYSENFVEYIKAFLTEPQEEDKYTYLFLIIYKLMDDFGRVFFNSGVIQILVENGENLRYPDRVNEGKCVEKFLSILSRNVDLEIMNKAGTIQEIYASEYVYDWNTDDQTPVGQLSNMAVQGCVIRGGALELLINLLSSLNDISFIKQIMLLVHHLITTGPIIYAEIANSNDILSICDHLQLPENDDADEISLLISQLHEFYHI